jgi:hypothetical protein
MKSEKEVEEECGVVWYEPVSDEKAVTEHRAVPLQES